MTFRVSMLVLNQAGSKEKTRAVVTNIGGCADAEEAKAKARQLYSVASFKSVEPEAPK